MGQPPLTSGRWRVEEVEGGGGGPSPAIDRGGRDPVTPAETGDGGESTCWFHNWALGPDGSLLGGLLSHYWGTPGSLLGDSWVWVCRVLVMLGLGCAGSQETGSLVSGVLVAMALMNLW